ncbi:acyl-coenzyme A thioesterase 5-like [Leucoraja erinacea]|uniref:acyl-coenzyme A thioesterase 5-like n=1 Tax=Leucoraja erinaceus TaxID=7782 RepID=UPI002454F58D|nr:acyl-coenzyme A thioesterase 5-like [Leucoraja erinacea]
MIDSGVTASLCFMLLCRAQRSLVGRAVQRSPSLYLAAVMLGRAASWLLRAHRGPWPCPGTKSRSPGSRGAATFSVTPCKSLADEDVCIRVAGLSRHQEVTLRAHALDEREQIFDSYAHYRADSHGLLDITHSPSLGGDYLGVVPMGLLWTLSPATMEMPYQKLRPYTNLIGMPMRIDLFLHSGHSQTRVVPGQILAKQTIERWYSKPGVRWIKLREGSIRGSLFLPPGDGQFPGVIDLFGDEGGLTEFRACLLASRGFATLALPYFGFEDLPRALTDLRLEYFEEAVDYLQKHPKVKESGVGVIGSSKGADLALSMITFIPKVVASVCISGCNANTLFDLYYKDVYLPSVKYNIDDIVCLDSGVLDVSKLIRDPQQNPKSIIPLEKAEGHILFVVGEDDKIWESKVFAEEAIKKLKTHRKNNYELLSYPGAGHHIEPPCSPFCVARINRFLGHPVLSGGEPIKHCYAQQDSWQKILQFFHSHLH